MNNEINNNFEVRQENVNNQPKKQTFFAQHKAVIIIISAILITFGILLFLFFSKEYQRKKGNGGILKNDKGENLKDISETRTYLKNNYDKFNIDGSTSMVPLHQAMHDLFSANKEKVLHNKTVFAFEKFIEGENDILLGVDYSDELLQKAKNNGVDIGKVKITREAFVFLINKNNPVKNLTINQIKDIYSGKITNWKQVGGDDAPIKAYQRNKDSGSQIRMNKFMGNTKLMKGNVEYIQEMSEIIEVMSKYDEGKYSIAYNMYTFTEKQYTSDEVQLLSVNGIEPNDDSIFNEQYPIVIYNYLYYNKNNKEASEFIEKLYKYLMNIEGQKMISTAGYINLNTKYDRNTNVNLPNNSNGQEENNTFDYYDEETGKFFNVNNDGQLITFDNYPDYLLRNTKYINNTKIRDYVTTLFNINYFDYYHGFDSKNGVLSLPNGSEFYYSSPKSFFRVKYNNKYYFNLEYHLDEDKFVLKTNTNNPDLLKDNKEELKKAGFPIDDIDQNIITITREELKNVYLTEYSDVGYDLNFSQIKYIQPFK